MPKKTRISATFCNKFIPEVRLLFEEGIAKLYEPILVIDTTNNYIL